MYSYPIVITPDTGDTVLLTFPDFPEAATADNDEGEAIIHARDALETAIIGRMSDGDDLPEPSRLKRGQLAIPLPTLSAAKVVLYLEMRATSVRKADLARRLECDFSQVARLLDLRHASRLDQIDAALAQLGRRIDLRLSESIMLATTAGGTNCEVPVDVGGVRRRERQAPRSAQTIARLRKRTG